MTLTDSTRVVVLHPGGLGDLVLLSPLLAGLKRRYPGCVVTLVCRSEFRSVSSLYPVPPDHCVGLDFNPYLWGAPTEEVSHLWAKAQEKLAGLKVDAFIDASLQPTWASWCIAALLRPPVAIRYGLSGAPCAVATQLVARSGVMKMPEIENIGSSEPLPEGERHSVALRYFQAAPESDARAWMLPAPIAEAAQTWLTGSALAGRDYIVCSPGGAVLKRWPQARFVEVLERAHRLSGHSALLVGEEREGEELERMARTLSFGAVAIFAGREQDIPLLGGLIARAKAYLSNDSGAMHLAQAFAVPGVAVFGGGGQWPRYAPWAVGSVGMVHPLPCFGCGWDCVLGHALCIESIPVDPVWDALERVGSGNARIVSLQNMEPAVTAVLDTASRHYRDAQKDRLERGQVILAMQGYVADLEQAAAERQALADAAVAAAARIHREAEANRKQFEAQAAEREGRIAMFEQAANERLALLEVIHAEAEVRRCCLEEVSAALAERDQVRAVQVSIGLGAGNIGDEVMARAFWSGLPSNLVLDVPLFPESARQHAVYPPVHRYFGVDEEGDETAGTILPALLVGATPVTEAEGLDWPLRFLVRRLEHFHRDVLPVDAVGVGVDRLYSPEALDLFRRGFLPIRSWTVRSEACRDALLSLGVEENRIKVGADWAWRYEPKDDLLDWARHHWSEWGVDTTRPLLVVNVVNMIWQDHTTCKQAIADALHKASCRWGLQIAFFCNECRDGTFFDAAAAAEVAAMIPDGAILVPNEYFSPDEAIALLSHATVTLAQRYHLVVQSVLAGTVPIAIPRGQKMVGLIAELGILTAGSVENVSCDDILAAIGQVMEGRTGMVADLQIRRRLLALRAAGNLDLVTSRHPYDRAFRMMSTASTRLAASASA